MRPGRPRARLQFGMPLAFAWKEPHAVAERQRGPIGGRFGVWEEQHGSDRQQP